MTLIAFAPTSVDAKYPTNSCVSGKQKAAGKYCSSVLKAHAKYASDPAKDAGGTERDASIAKAVTKLGSGWTKSEAFRKAHQQARMPDGILSGHPRLESFEAILEQVN